MGEFKLCPRRYQLSIVEGWQSNQTAEALLFGIAYHACHEHHAHQLASGASVEEALHSTVREAFRLSAQWRDHSTARSRPALVRALVWYFDHYSSDTISTVILSSGQPAVELSFKLFLSDEFTYAGHLDRLVEFAGDTWVLDYKSTTSYLTPRYFAGFRPDGQMSGYSVAGRVISNQPIAGVIVDAVQLLAGSASFARDFSARTEDELDAWLTDLTEWWLPLATRCAETQVWPMNDKACGLYGGCQFREICSKPRQFADQFLRANFTRRVWDPSIPR